MTRTANTRRPAPDHDSPYRPGADAWYMTATRAVLAAAGIKEVDIFPGVADIPDDGFAVHLWHAQEVGRVMVQVFITSPAVGRRKARVYDSRSTRASVATDERWDAACVEVCYRLERAGFTGLTRMKCGVRAHAPRPEQQPTVEIVHRNVFEQGVDELGKHDLHVAGHPHLHGLLVTSHVYGSRPMTYVYAHADDEHPVWPQGFGKLDDAADSWALHCGLPPVNFVQR